MARPVGPMPDIGAFEYDGPPEEPTLVVTTLADAADPYDFRTSLREAITLANTTPEADTIEFAEGLTGTITLTPGPPRPIHGHDDCRPRGRRAHRREEHGPKALPSSGSSLSFMREK